MYETVEKERQLRGDTHIMSTLRGWGIEGKAKMRRYQM